MLYGMCVSLYFIESSFDAQYIGGVLMETEQREGQLIICDFTCAS